MLEKLKQFLSRPGSYGRAPELSELEPEKPIVPRRIDPLITKADVEAIGLHILPKLNYAKIRRTMQLFDIRWIDDQMVSFIPDEDQIIRFASELAVRTLKNGRILGPCILRDRSFLASYGYGQNGEVISLEYILTGANNVD